MKSVRAAVDRILRVTRELPEAEARSPKGNQNFEAWLEEGNGCQSQA
ncbi:MAG: hypothetical protein JKY94_07345 [Rhodobacteraceae bacterium]|nr:hypothetical protein [Paracoccaceae bacterium]